MKKTTLVDKATTPDGQVMGLYEQDGHYTIRVAGYDLMSTRRHASEERLAELGCAGLAENTKAHVLIGGLGFGYTLRATLALVHPQAKVTVAELMPEIVQWNQNPAYPLAADVLKDRRVRIVQKDVGLVLANSKAQFDSILLDVDNGPAALSTERNRRLYQKNGLAEVLKALRPGGRVAFWSAAEDPRFAKRMEDTGFAVKTHRARAHTTSGSFHTLFLGTQSTRKW